MSQGNGCGSTGYTCRRIGVKEFRARFERHASKPQLSGLFGALRWIPDAMQAYPVSCGSAKTLVSIKRDVAV